MNYEVSVFIGILYCLVLFYVPFFWKKLNLEKFLMIGGTWAVMFLPGLYGYIDWNWFLNWFVITFGILFFWYYIGFISQIAGGTQNSRAHRRHRENDEWYPPTVQFQRLKRQKMILRSKLG